MLKYILFISTLLFLSFVGQAKVWNLNNSTLSLSFEDETGLIGVKDHRIQQTWNQISYAENYKVRVLKEESNSILVQYQGAFKFQVSYTLNQSSLEVAIHASEKEVLNEMEFPSAFETPCKDYYLLETDGEGMLLPVDDTGYPLGKSVTYFCGGGLAMAWMGMVDKDFETGYMAVLETPYDAALKTKRENGLITFSPVWLPSLGKFGYERKVTYHFFDKGGYVAQAKTYRDYIWQKNQVVTLKENAAKLPSIDKMVGGVQLYVWDNAREIEFAEELKEAGIEKALFLWDANHIPYPANGYDVELEKLGYATGGYELFTDLKQKDTLLYDYDSTGPLRFAHAVYPGKFNKLAARKSDGSTYFNQFGHTTCPKAIQPEITRKIEAKLKEYPHETFFLDVYQANGIFECYSKEHPLSREQFGQVVKENLNSISEKYNVYLGGEWGADFLGSSSVYVQGMMTLQRTWFNSEIVKEGTIYYFGNWQNNARPSQMLGSRVASPTYLKYSINEYTRVPLYELVYHDAVVTTWRWEDGNHHYPEIWWKKDLFNILYGTAPLWNLDRNRWEAYKNTFIESYQNVCPWLQQIVYDELVSHRFVTDDHKVQESVFSSGKKVIVNFGNEHFLYKGRIIDPRGYIIEKK